MRLTPNLSFGGPCEAAFKLCERCFGGIPGEKQPGIFLRFRVSRACNDLRDS
jgi:hypothetical protein